MPVGILVDANVLYSRTLRDWVFMLRNATGGSMFTVHATEDIVAEVIYNLRRDKPAAPGRLTSGVRDNIVRSLDSLVTDYTVDGSFPGDDPDDAHVHAAAVSCAAEKLVTADAGFAGVPEDIAAQLPYEVHTPDSFFVLVDDSTPQSVALVATEQERYWAAKDGSRSIVEQLRSAGCPEFAQRVRTHLARMRPTP